VTDHIRESRVWVAGPREVVFALFADPHRLESITPPWLRLRLETPVETLTAGAVLDFRLRWLGLPIRWRTFIREYDPPFRFVDVQVRGPYARWEHRHMFLHEGEGTWVEDRVTYRLPLGPLGHLAHAIAVRRQLDAIWRYRDRRVVELVGAVKPSAASPRAFPDAAPRDR
jgi:ligand-binding SRPBCC domain-containing protein